MSIKVFHTGDLHIGMTYGNRDYPPEIKQELINSRINTLERLIDIANENECDLFLVTGDMFHRTKIKKEYILKTAQIISRFEGNCCAILPGNHDHLEAYDSIWESFKKEVSDHVLLLDKEISYDLSDYGLDVTLYPAPCYKKHSSNNNIGWISKVDNNKLSTTWNFGVAHGSIKGVSPDFDSQYYPMEEDELENTGLDHWFLGHTHITYPETNSINPTFTYCGTPEPDGFDCKHGGYARIAEISTKDDKSKKPRIESKIIETGEFKFTVLEKNISSSKQILEIKDKVKSAPDKTLLRLNLSGTLDKEEFDLLYDAIKIINEEFLYLEFDDSEVNIAITPSLINEEFPEDSFPALLLNRLGDMDENDSLQIAFQMFRKVKNNDYK
ncbi:metallophosphoesterase family protein [Natranaerofaba carboxydovora]|uniref:metallophosphoesterase family protein n=1 Tax=Natranaerofaba carboxydovora TaxID=2742683 RepID=UPI001F1493E1|nr:metallophosphoesterase [Natranaerofaba carboxydovora]UMZ73795.1 Calcineurin-like phosphoesterase [Natranaerofaba carboxydovora]